ncbi:hypothetical protein ABW45_04580 [Stenotrophomonas maltophilia]|nr:hypothetical protein ABW45_04580 [Stenotrophomonas maltophilia]
MTTSVDVLAVMEELAGKIWRQDDSDPILALADEARAAVAELIEAVEKLFGADMEHCMEMDGKEDQLEAVQFAKSALDRVKGA